MKLDISSVRPIAEQVIIQPGRLSDEYLFTLKAVSILFYKNSISARDIKSNFTDGPNDGGIDFIYADSNTMFLIQGKSTEDLKKKDILAEIIVIKQTINDFENDREGKYSKQLIQTYQNEYDLLDDNKNIEIVIVTNTQFSDDEEAKINYAIQKMDDLDFKVSIFDLKYIEEVEASINTNSELIDEDSIEIDKPANVLEYGENGLIVNVKASSVKRLYQKHVKRGLFSYNLREYISQKAVDDAIKYTINNPKERINFWYFNNGITIGCKDFNIDGNKIKLYGFSIINGAQTTTKIGESIQVNSDCDFYLPCKLIKASNGANEQFQSDFIQKVSEASNSQKPIKPRDLKANAPEQKLLQDKAYRNEYKLAIEIKRGVKPKSKGVEKWQKVTNEYLGQLIYAILLQHPGQARSSKSVIFGSTKVYNQVFKNITHDYDTLYDLVKLAAKYKEYLNKKSSRVSELSAEDEFGYSRAQEEYAIADNGKLTILAVVLCLVKKQRDLIVDLGDKENLCANNIKGLFLSNYREDDFEQKLNDLFDFIVEKIAESYSTNKAALKITSYSNFFKTDKVYYDVILPIFDNLRTSAKRELDNLMSIFSN